MGYQFSTRFLSSTRVSKGNIFTCEGENCHLGTGAQEVPDLLDIVSAAGDDVDHARGHPGLVDEGGQGEGGQGGVLARLHNTRAAYKWRIIVSLHTCIQL